MWNKMRIYRTKKKPKPSKNLHKVNSRKSRTTSFPTTIMTNGGFSEGWQGWLVILKIIGKNSSIFSVTNILCVKHFLIWFKFECLLKMYNVALAILSLLWRSLDFMNPLVIRQKGESQNKCFKKAKHAIFSEKWTFLTPWYTHLLWALKKHPSF